MKKVDSTIGIIALILNIIVLPGLGSLIGRRIKEGIIQIVLTIVGSTMVLFGLITFADWGIEMLGISLGGIILTISAYIWAIITSIQILKDAE